MFMIVLMLIITGDIVITLNDGHADYDDVDYNFDRGFHHGPLYRCLVWEVCWGRPTAGKSSASYI